MLKNLIKIVSEILCFFIENSGAPGTNESQIIEFAEEND